MSLAVAVLLAAVVVGWARGGALSHLDALALRRPRLLVGALVAQAAGAVVGGPLHPAGLAASALLVAGFLLANRGVRGTGLLALGLAANALVVGLNGAMPVSTDAAARAGAPVEDVRAGLDPRHELLDDGTRLPALADVVPVPLPVRPEVVSAGDVLVAAGLAQLLVVAMGSGRRGRRRPAPPPSDPLRPTRRGRTRPRPPVTDRP